MAARPEVLLAGDIGATKTVLALYPGWPGKPFKQQTFRNADYGDFWSLLEKFLDAGCPRPVRACLGIAGPVVANQVHMTNLNWSIDGREMCRRFGLQQVYLINDLVATAVGAVHLPDTECAVLNPGRAQAGAVQAVLAPGSGLGEGFLIPYGGSFLPCASEGGHASFAPRNELQADLLAFMRSRQAHVSVEQVCSGLAIPSLFAFLSTRFAVPSWLSDQLQQAVDPTPVVLGAAMQAVAGGISCEVAEQTLALFLDILADEAANLVLKTLAFGGLFLGGGLSARLQSCIRPEQFMAIFCRGTYRDRLADVPVRIILNPKTALLGAAAYGAGAVIN
ncbi:MAG: glucokinase [Desulfobulbus sp.]|nr:glucokinase [Desulfobulbus sp.]